MTSVARRVTFSVSRERAVDLDTDVWYAGPVDAPIRSGVSAGTLAELQEAVEAIKHFVLGAPDEATVIVEYVYDLPGITPDVWRAHRELQARLHEAGLSEDDRAALLLSA